MKSLSLVLLLVVLAGLVYADDQWQPKTSEQIKTFRHECLAENPIPEDILVKMRRLEFSDEESVRKYVLCTAKKLGVFCEHEGYHADRMAKQFKMDLTEEQALAIAQGCIDKNEQGSSVDAWAFRGYKCIMDSEIGTKVRAFIKRKQDEAAKTA